MNSLEYIHIRITTGTRQSLLELVRLNLTKRENSEQINVYYHAVYDTDLCVYLCWNDKLPSRGSETGIRIAAGLREFGIVRHSVWYEALNPNQSRRLS